MNTTIVTTNRQGIPDSGIFAEGRQEGRFRMATIEPVGERLPERGPGLLASELECCQSRPGGGSGPGVESDGGCAVTGAYALRRDLGLWHLTFAGQGAMLKH